MIIYKATNTINGKCYIGKTIQALNVRISRHLWDAKNGGFYFHNAIKKYGIKNFKFEVIKKLKNENCLNASEIFFIQFYNSIYPNGYNLTIGGQGVSGYKHSEEYKKELSERYGGKNNPMYGKKRLDLAERNRLRSGEDNPFYGIGFWNGKKHSEETKRKISKALEGKSNPFYGRKHTIETKMKISKKLKGNIPWNKKQ